MHNHTLGWTSDNGCNNFAVGWLTIASIIFTPGGGISDDVFLTESQRRRRQNEQAFLAILIAAVQQIERDRTK